MSFADIRHIAENMQAGLDAEVSCVLTECRLFEKRAFAAIDINVSYAEILLKNSGYPIFRQIIRTLFWK